jgi:hypothetical protein
MDAQQGGKRHWWCPDHGWSEVAKRRSKMLFGGRGYLVGGRSLFRPDHQACLSRGHDDMVRDGRGTPNEQDQVESRTRNPRCCYIAFTDFSLDLECGWAWMRASFSLGEIEATGRFF